MMRPGSAPSGTVDYEVQRIARLTNLVGTLALNEHRHAMTCGNRCPGGWSAAYVGLGLELHARGDSDRAAMRELRRLIESEMRSRDARSGIESSPLDAQSIDRILERHPQLDN